MMAQTRPSDPATAQSEEQPKPHVQGQPEAAELADEQLTVVVGGARPQRLIPCF